MNRLLKLRSKKDIYKADILLITVALGVLLAFWISAIKPLRPVLTVWSCGGNYESLSAFCDAFEREYNCRVRYTAAPVQYLLEMAIDAKNPPDILVGRAGPGWQALRKAGKMKAGPVFFAMDPFVIATPSDNPAGIRDLVDLGSQGVRVAISSKAMRPRGKCPAHLAYTVDKSFSPGFCERWKNNGVSQLQCGRDLLDPILQNKADATIVPRSVTTAKGVLGNIEVLEIAPKYLLAMKQCRASIPQCCAILSTTRQDKLAEAFVSEMLGQMGRNIFSEHGYLAIDSPDAKKLGGLIRIANPKDTTAEQMQTAMRLFEVGKYRTALQEFLSTIHTYGPSKYDAQARYYAGLCLYEMQKPNEARTQWTLLLHEFPRKGKNEWSSKVLNPAKNKQGLQSKSDSHWVGLAKEQLSSNHSDNSKAESNLPKGFSITHRAVTEGDPEFNGARNLELAKDLLEINEYESAAEVLLKVITLNYPSKHMREARFWLGMTSFMRGLEGLAVSDWNELAKENDFWSNSAKNALLLFENNSARHSGIDISPPPPILAYQTHTDRKTSYSALLRVYKLTNTRTMEADKDTVHLSVEASD